MSHPDYFNHAGHADHDPARDQNFRPKTRRKPVPHLSMLGGIVREITRPEAATILRYARRTPNHRPQGHRIARMYCIGLTTIHIGP